MATQAALLERTGFGALPVESPAPAGWDEAVEEDRLRPLPFEDVYLHAKKIDNSRVVRRPNAGARRRCWQTIVVSSIGAIVLMIVSLPNLLGTITGYEVQELERRHVQLLRDKEALEVEEAALLSPQRLEELAREMQLYDPAPSQIVVANPKADGSLAHNVPTK
jgi:cell division protein FtsL